jgi:hypothetical protein
MKKYEPGKLLVPGHFSVKVRTLCLLHLADGFVSAAQRMRQI